MQSAVGVLLATLTFILRDSVQRRRLSEPASPLAPCERELFEEPPPAPSAKFEVSCPESLVDPGIVEDIVRRVKVEDCKCAVDCTSFERDLKLVGLTGLALCLGQAAVAAVVLRRRRLPLQDGPRRVRPDYGLGHRKASFGAGVIE